MCFLFLRFKGCFMKKMRMCFPREKTFEDGFKEYILDCKARNLRVSQYGFVRHWLQGIALTVASGRQ